MFEVPSTFRPSSIFGPPPMFTGIAQAATGVESTWCLSFDGSNDWVSVGTSAGYTPSTASYSCWIQTSDAGSSYRFILCRNVNIGITCLSNVLGVYDWSGSGQLSSGVNIADGLWHNVVFIKRAGVTNGSYLYVDGILRLTTTYYSDTGGADLAIGSNSSGGQNFSGRIDDVRIYSRALSSTEVNDIYTNTSPPTDVAAYLDLEEGTGTSTAVKDSTGSTIATATLTNGPVWHPQTPPKLVSNRVTSARSLSFDGVNDYVTFSQIDLGTTNTICAWVFISTFNQYKNVIIGGDGETFVFWRSGSNTNVYYYANGNGCYVAIPSWSEGQWVHLAAVRSGTNVTFYCNGVSQGSASMGLNSLVLKYIGCYQAGYHTNGLIDDVRIYSRALSAAEVQKLCRGQNPTTNDPVGWWKLDETSGTTAVDSGSGGNNGTHVNGPTISTDVPAWLSA